MQLDGETILKKKKVLSWQNREFSLRKGLILAAHRQGMWRIGIGESGSG